MASASRYTLDNTWDKAERRLALLEAEYDPGTVSRMTRLGIAPGWRALELGAGRGSMARWMCEAVGPGGEVTAVDLEPRFLEADPRPNLQILRHDLVADGVPGAGYDLVHARMLLMHLPDRDQLLADMVRALRPGGVLLVEEADFYPIATAASARYVETWERCVAVAGKAGGDWTWARQLPSLACAAGLVDVEAVSEVAYFRSGDLWARLLDLSWEQLTPALIADGADRAGIDAARAELADPTRWFPAFALLAVSGSAPR